MLLNQGLIELFSFLYLSFSAAVPGDGGERCSLLLPACLKPLETADFCLFTRIPSSGGKHDVVLSLMEGEKVFLKGTKLILYDYPEGSEAVFSQGGGVYLLHAAAAPVTALDYRGNMVLEVLRKSDGQSWGGGVMDLLKGGRGWVNLQFEEKKGARRAMLLVDGGSTHMAAQRIDSYLAEALRGPRTQEPPGMLPGDLPGRPGKDESRTGKPKSVEELGKDRTFIKKFRQWMLEELALHIKVWNGREWKEAAAVNPWLFRKTVGVMLDLRGAPQEDGIKVRLEVPTALWTVDRVAMDFSPEGPLPALHVSRLKVPDVIDKESRLSFTLPRYREHSSRVGLLAVQGYYLRGTTLRPPWQIP